jgi:tetratricopeptide (TPR) repeat protein
MSPTLRLQPPELHYNLGYVLHQQAAFEQAAENYRKAIVLGRQAAASFKHNSANAHHNLGIVLAEQGQWLAAVYHYRRVLAAQPDNLMAYCNLGTALLQQGQTTAAIQLYQQAIALSEQQPARSPELRAVLYHHLAQAFHQQYQLPEAIAAYRQTLKIDPTKALAHYHLGRAYQLKGEFELAVRCFQAALRLDLKLAVAAGECGFALLSLGRFAEAMVYLQRSLAPDRAFVRAYCNQTEQLVLQTAADEWVEAKIAAGRFLQTLLQSPEAAELKGQLVALLQHWGNVMTQYGGSAQLRCAERLYQRAIQLQPKQPDLYLQLAHCLTRQGRRQTAVLLCHFARAIAPKDSRPYWQLGQLLSHQQQWQQARQYYRQARRLGQQEGNPKSQIQNPKWSNPPATAPQSCEGLNCQPCLRSLTQWFAPVRLQPGIYRLPDRPPASPSSLPSASEVEILPQGKVWVVPQENAWKVCHAIAVFSADGQFLPQYSRQYPGQLPHCQQTDPQTDQVTPAVTIPQSLAQPQKVAGTVAVLSGLSGHVYFHWMVDILPRVEILRQKGIDLGQIDYFLVNSQQFGFQRETLQALGIAADRIIESDRCPYLQAERLIVPSFPGPLGGIQPWVVEWLPRIYLSKLYQSFAQSKLNPIYAFNASQAIDGEEQPCCGHPSNYPTRIYLSRADAHHRRVLNEGQVCEYLQSLGFAVLILDGLSVVEQASLFAHADVIVAPHGSSLTNLVFCQRRTQVIELVSPNYIRHYYWWISQQLGLEHYIVSGSDHFCDSLRQLLYPNPLTEDLWVDFDRLQFVLQQIGIIDSP